MTIEVQSSHRCSHFRLCSEQTLGWFRACGNRLARPQLFASAGVFQQIQRAVGILARSWSGKRKLHGRMDGVVGDLELMMRFEANACGPEDRCHRGPVRLGHVNSLKPTLQRRVDAEHLHRFGRRRGADARHVAPGKDGFQQVRCVHPASAPGQDEEMYFIDKYDGSFEPGSFEKFLNAFLQISAVLRACEKSSELKLEESAAAQREWNRTRDDALGQTLYQSGFPHAWISEKKRIGLCPPAEDTKHEIHLRIASDHRVELTRRRPRGEIAAEGHGIRHDGSGSDPTEVLF